MYSKIKLSKRKQTNKIVQLVKFDCLSPIGYQLLYPYLPRLRVNSLYSQSVVIVANILGSSAPACLPITSAGPDRISSGSLAPLQNVTIKVRMTIILSAKGI